MNLFTPEELEAAQPIIALFVFVFGACVGSFLNVVVWRLPRGESLLAPPSHCPKCGAGIRAIDNIPIVSWLLLGGRCRRCAEPISLRYPAVELSTALLFLAVLWRCDALGLSYAVLPGWLFLTGCLVAAGLTDAEFRVIPNKLTYTGIIAALLLAVLLPGGRIIWTMSDSGAIDPAGPEAGIIGSMLPGLTGHPRLLAAASTLGGACIGAALLWTARIIGRLFWGRRTHRPDNPQVLTVKDGILTVGADFKCPVNTLLLHPSDRLRAEAEDVSVQLKDGSCLSLPASEKASLRLEVGPSFVRAGSERVEPGDLAELRAAVRKWSVPREVLGLGDVKLLAVIGGFLGMTATLFVLMFSSLIGFAAGLLLLLRSGHRDWSLPYGPHLAGAGMLWLFLGPEAWEAFEFLLLSLGETLAFM